MARQIRETDWRATALGPVETWCAEVRSMLLMVLDAPTPMTMCLGTDLLLLYNDACSNVLCDRHPGALGRPAREAFAGISETLGCRLEHVLAQGCPATIEHIAFQSDCSAMARDAVFNLRLTPILRNGEGRPIGVVTHFEETSDVMLTEREVLKREERFRQFGDASFDVIWMIDARSGRFEYISPAFEKVWGVKRGQVLQNRSQVAHYVHPSDRSSVDDANARVMSGEDVQLDYRIVRPDGEVRHIREVGFAIRERHGKDIVRIGGIAQDRTDRVRQRKATQDSERRFQTLVEGIPQLVWRGTPEGQCSWVSPQWTRYTGLSFAESLGDGWLQAVHPDDRERALRDWRMAASADQMKGKWRFRRGSDGAYRWFQTLATPVREQGEIVEWLGASTYVEDMVLLQERQKLLLAELQHRVRNLLAMVRSIIRQSADGYEDVDDYVAHLTGRIDAMARTQVMLTRKAGAAIDLEGLIRDELSRVAEEDRLALTGPEVELSAKAAEVLTLAIHELATNSIKYGALGSDGRLAVRWFVTNREDGEWLEVMWEEACTCRVVEAVRRGFGTELIEGRVPYELKGEGSMRVRPDGVLAEIAFPLKEGASILQPGPGGSIGDDE